MAAKSDYVSGTITLTNGDAAFTGAATGWLLAGFKEGDTIIDITGATEFMGVVATIDANGAGTLTKAWEGPTLTNVAYRMRYQPDGARVSAQARNLIELLGNGNVLALAGLSGSANQVPMFTGPGAMTLVPKTDLVSGVAYDVLVDLLADRAAYDGQAEGFSVLVADVGDGRSAVYAKASASSGDWSAPAYVTGPVGPFSDVTVGTVTTGAPGSSVIVTPTPIPGGVELDFTIPSGRGQVPRGDYNPATAYVLDDAVLDNGSTWILTAPTSTGNAPPVLPTTSNAWWQLQARRGVDGAGTVTTLVAGAGIAVDNTDPTAPIISAVSDVTFGDVQSYWLGSNLEIAELAPAYLLIGMEQGNGLFDGFNATTAVDVAGATNLDTGTVGEIGPNSTTDSDSSVTPSTPGWDLAALTIWDRAWSIDNSKTVNKIGIFSTPANTFVLKVVERTGSAVYATRASEGFSHPGGGWAWKTLSSPYAVPGSGTFYAAVYQASGLIDGETGSRGFYGAGEMSGTGNSCTENSGTRPALGVEYSGVSRNNVTVRSVAVNVLEAPDWGRLRAIVLANDAGVNSDLVFSLSRDGTHTAALTMAEMFTRPDGSIVVDSGIVDLTGITTGVAARWHAVSANNKNPRIKAIAAVFGVNT